MQTVEVGHVPISNPQRAVSTAVWLLGLSYLYLEVATNEPGFDRDEDSAHLGEALRLPKQHAHLRDYLERHLEPLP